jgi:hypothetical protein
VVNLSHKIKEVFSELSLKETELLLDEYFLLYKSLKKERVNAKELKKAYPQLVIGLKEKENSLILSEVLGSFSKGKGIVINSFAPLFGRLKTLLVYLKKVIVKYDVLFDYPKIFDNSIEERIQVLLNHNKKYNWLFKPLFYFVLKNVKKESLNIIANVYAHEVMHYLYYLYNLKEKESVDQPTFTSILNFFENEAIASSAYFYKNFKAKEDFLRMRENILYLMEYLKNLSLIFYLSTRESEVNIEIKRLEFPVKSLFKSFYLLSQYLGMKIGFELYKKGCYPKNLGEIVDFYKLSSEKIKRLVNNFKSDIPNGYLKKEKLNLKELRKVICVVDKVLLY